VVGDVVLGPFRLFSARNKGVGRPTARRFGGCYRGSWHTEGLGWHKGRSGEGGSPRRGPPMCSHCDQPDCPLPTFKKGRCRMQGRHPASIAGAGHFGGV